MNLRALGPIVLAGGVVGGCAVEVDGDTAAPSELERNDDHGDHGDHGGIHRVKHVIIVMMENHSFDNYFGALAYAPGSPYHASSMGCAMADHGCVDGLSCTVDSAGALTCTNSNPEDRGSAVAAFHATSRCVVPDLAHSWLQSHLEANFNDPNATLVAAPNDGFVRVNDVSDQPD